MLIITSWHLRRADLWSLKAMRDRPLVVLDEDALSAIAAPVELNVDRLRGFIDNLQAVGDASAGGEADAAVAWLSRRLGKPMDGNFAALAMTGILRRAAENVLRACATAGYGMWSPSDTVMDQIMTDYDRELLENQTVFAALVRKAYDAARRRTMLPNMLADLRELLQKPRPVHLSVGACRWTRTSSIPADRQVIMLDATAEPTVVEGILARAVTVIDTPPIMQKATIYQVMDKVATRAGNRRDMDNEQSWTIKLATEVARKHRGQSLLCITFKNDAGRLGDLLDQEHGSATVVHYGALRGLNAFENYRAGLIIGRPMPNEAQLQLLAVAAFGRDALDEDLKSPPLNWCLHTHDVGPDTWTVRCQRYANPRWQAVWRHTVTGESMQAVGRLRPLTNDPIIYVITSETLPPTLDVTAVNAAELFPSLSASVRRTDFQDRVRQYAQTMESLAEAGLEPTNRAVCDKLGIRECNGFRYRNLALPRARPP